MNTIKYILGIDFGHGETTAALFDISNNEVFSIDIIGSLKEVKSTICKVYQDDKYRWEINPSPSTIQTSLKQANLINKFPFYSYFKGPVVDSENGELKAIETEKKEQFKEFIAAIYKKILDTHKDKLNCKDKNFILYVACPSGWDEKQRVAYKEFINSIQVPLDHLKGNSYHIECADVVKESDAAFISNRNKIKNFGTVSRVLVIDYGSSTIDFTYYGDNCIISDGADLGASIVEECIYDYLVNEVETIKKVFDKTVSYSYHKSKVYLRETMLNIYRKRKEDFFDEIRKNKTESIDCDYTLSKILSDAPKDLRWLVENESDWIYYDKLKTEILNSNKEYLIREDCEGNCKDNRKYLDKVKKKFKEVAQKIGGAENVDHVILTGSASCMPFVEEFVKEIFGVSQENKSLHFDGERKHSISKGIAKWGNFHYNSTSKINKIHKELETEFGIIYDAENNKYETTRAVDFEKNVKNLAKEIIIKAYTRTISNIITNWLSPNTTILIKKDHTLNEDICKLLDNKEKYNITDDNIWGKIEYGVKRDSIQNNTASLHALFRKIFDCIDGDLIEEIKSDLDSAFQKKYEETLLKQIKKYEEVYFPKGGNDDSFEVKLDKMNININIDEDQKLYLLKDLLEKSYKRIDMYSKSSNLPLNWYGSSNLTLNWYRSYKTDIIGVVGRSHFVCLNEIVDPFVEGIKPDFPNIRKVGEDIQKYVIDYFEKLRKKCELSLYKVDSKAFDSTNSQNDDEYGKL